MVNYEHVQTNTFTQKSGKTIVVVTLYPVGFSDPNSLMVNYLCCCVACLFTLCLTSMSVIGTPFRRMSNSRISPQDTGPILWNT